MYHPARGTITIEAKSEGMDEHNKLYIPSDFGIMTWMSSTGSDYPWQDRQGFITSVDNNNIQSINGVLRNPNAITVNLETECYRSYESGFIDLLNVHNVYLHCPNLGHFTSIGVGGENTIIKKVPVPSSFGYLIIGSMVAPHDKIDVSRQLIKTIQFSLRGVYGSVINLHGAAISFSLVFVTIDYLLNSILNYFVKKYINNQKMVGKESREQVEEIINNNGEPVKEAVIETIIEEEIPKPEAKPKVKSRAKPNIKITKEPVEEAIQKMKNNQKLKKNQRQ